MNDVSSLTVKAPAKINLFLKVLGKRGDGYHNIYSLVQTVDLYDSLTLEKIDDGIKINCVSPGVPLDPENLIWKSIDLLQKHTGFRGGVYVDLIKRIPIGAGLGGGSSDAAATMKGVNKLYDLGMKLSRLKSLGAQIGSDVPFFFSHGTAIISGRGEIVEDCPISTMFRVLLVVPNFGISSAQAYSKLSFSLTTFPSEPIFSSKVSGEELFEALKRIGNDFEEMVIRDHPEIAGCMQSLREAGARKVALSGSGSALFGLFDLEPDQTLLTAVSGRFGWQVYSLSPVTIE